MDNSYGSVWRKWDLHFHTPASFDYGQKNYSFSDLANDINNSDIDAIAITDHWTLEGYEKIKPIIKNKLVIPGIELRIDKSTRNPMRGSGKSVILQAIVLFPPEITLKEIEKTFLYQINLCEEKNNWRLTREDIVKLGEKFDKKGLTEKEYYKYGCEQAYVDYKQVIDNAHKLRGLVCLTYDKYGGFDHIDPIKDSVFKSNLVKDCDLIETNNEDIRKAFMGNGDILRCCEKMTPCFKGSDSHRPSDFGRNFVWIKSIFSFEGLRQVKFFPRERISYSVDKPNYSYPRITRIKLKNINREDPLGTLTEEVCFNDNLNSIIGHPSIGKSTLAELIAYVFGVETSTEPGEEESKIENLKKLNSKLEIEIEVAIGGTTRKISRNILGKISGDFASNEFKITYLRQGLIDRIARDAEEVNNRIFERLDKSELRTIKERITSAIKSVSSIRDKYLGRYIMEHERNQTNSQLEQIDKLSQFSQSAEYKTLKVELEKAKNDEIQLNNAISEMEELENITGKYIEELQPIKITLSLVKKLFPSLKNQKLLDPRFTAVTVQRCLLAFIEKAKISRELEEAHKNKNIIIGLMKDLFKKEKISVTENKLREVDEQKSDLIALLSTQERHINEAVYSERTHFQGVELLKEYVREYEKTNSNQLKEFNKNLDKIQVVYENSDREPWLIHVLTDEAKDAWEKYTPDDEKKQHLFIKPSEPEILELISRIKKEQSCDIDGVIKYFEKCLNEKTIPIKTKALPEHIKWLFGGYGPVIPKFISLRIQEYSELGKNQVYYDGKNISTKGLSFTERCGALLEIFLQKGDEPLLLDQPEDNLGASYVTSTLIPRLIEKKIERQIIIINGFVA